MTWRKWIIRAVVLIPLGILAVSLILYEYWTSSEALQQMVQQRFESELVDVQVTVQKATARLFGGITLTELRFRRRDNLNNQDFAYAPRAVLYHDKERILTGELNVRKIEIQQPRIRLVRRRDGTWNVSGIFPKTDPSQALPTISVQQGTITFVDQKRGPEAVVLEIRNVALTLINDPIPTLTFEGSGVCDLVGPVNLSGSVERSTGNLALQLSSPQIPLTDSILSAVRTYAPDALEDLGSIQGTGSLSGTVNWRPEDPVPLRYDLTAKIEKGEVKATKLPWKLKTLSASVHLVDQHIPKAWFRAQVGSTQTELEGSLTHLDLGSFSDALSFENFCHAATEVSLIARHVEVDQPLCDCWKEMLQEYLTEYSPSGSLTVDFSFKKRSPSQWQKRWLLQAEQMRARYIDCPYPIEGIKGSIEILTVGAPTCSPENAQATEACCFGEESSRVQIDLQGWAGRAPVHLSGTVDGTDSTSGVDLRLKVEGIPIDKVARDSLQTLSPKSVETLDSFKLTGKVIADVEITRAPGTREIQQHSIIQLSKGTARYQEFPLPLRQVSGTFELFPDHWEFRHFVGHYGKKGVVRASGRSHPRASEVVIRRTTHFPVEEEQTVGGSLQSKDDRISVTIEGENIPLDREFRKALIPGRPSLAKAWDDLAITGQMSFVAVIDELPDQPRDIDVTVTVGGCRMKPKFLPYELTDVSGTVRYYADSAHLTEVKGRHGQTEFLIDRGTILLKGQGGYWARFDELRAMPLVLDDDFLEALPPALRKAARELKLKQPFWAKTILVVDQSPEAGSGPTIYWKSLVNLVRAKVQAGVDLENLTGKITCEGLYRDGQVRDVVGRLDLKTLAIFNQPLTNLQARFAVWKDSPDILRVWDLHADCFKGRIGGQGRIELGSIFRYALLLRAAQVELQEFGNHNLGKDADLSGLATAGLYLEGEGKSIDGLRGSGNVDVPQGKMAKLPFLLDLMKWLGFRVPDRTAFEQAYVTVQIEGRKAKITKLDLLGNAISVRGDGTVDLDGTNLNLDLNVEWGRLAQLLPPGVDRLTRGISDQLLRIRAYGKLSDVEFEKRFVPIVTDPLKRMFNGKRNP